MKEFPDTFTFSDGLSTVPCKILSIKFAKYKPEKCKWIRRQGMFWPENCSVRGI